MHAYDGVYAYVRGLRNIYIYIYIYIHIYIEYMHIYIYIYIEYRLIEATAKVRDCAAPAEDDDRFSYVYT